MLCSDAFGLLLFSSLCIAPNHINFLLVLLRMNELNFIDRPNKWHFVMNKKRKAWILFFFCLPSKSRSETTIIFRICNNYSSFILSAFFAFVELTVDWEQERQKKRIYSNLRSSSWSHQFVFIYDILIDDDRIKFSTWFHSYFSAIWRIMRLPDSFVFFGDSFFRVDIVALNIEIHFNVTVVDKNA